MNNKLKTGLVVLNYNDYKTTIKLIKMIKNYKSIDLIVIVDNCSTDKSYKKINEYYLVVSISLVVLLLIVAKSMRKKHKITKVKL